MVLVIRSHSVSIWAIRAAVIRVTDIHFVEKRPLAIAAVNAELPPFQNGEHNSESVSTIDRVITPLSYPKNSIIICYSVYSFRREDRIMNQVWDILEKIKAEGLQNNQMETENTDPSTKKSSGKKTEEKVSDKFEDTTSSNSKKQRAGNFTTFCIYRELTVNFCHWYQCQDRLLHVARCIKLTPLAVWLRSRIIKTKHFHWLTARFMEKVNFVKWMDTNVKLLAL